MGERARMGRPPNRKPGDHPLRQKATLWVSAELMADYRDWTWTERCSLGELVERAMSDYRRRRRRPVNSGTEDETRKRK